jgi:hypothetical protein
MIEFTWFLYGFMAGILFMPVYNFIKYVIEEIGYMRKEW